HTPHGRRACALSERVSTLRRRRCFLRGHRARCFTPRVEPTRSTGRALLCRRCDECRDRHAPFYQRTDGQVSPAPDFRQTAGQAPRRVDLDAPAPARHEYLTSVWGRAAILPTQAPLQLEPDAARRHSEGTEKNFASVLFCALCAFSVPSVLNCACVNLKHQ